MRRWVARLLVVAGLVLLAWSALIVADATVAQRAARRSLAAVSRADTLSVPGTPGVRKSAPPEPLFARGDPVAVLSVPRVDLSVVVLHGSDAQTLRRGPGHLENTPLPGDSGNMVVAGHRDSFFRPLRDVKRGDDIFVDTAQARFHYRVTSLRVVDPRDLSVLESTHAATLTLITCYPFWVLGDAPDRFIVRATRVGQGAATVLVPGSAPSPPAVRRDRPHVANDETLVREAIERFRVAYNARLLSHPQGQPATALRFETCEVTTTGDQAAAVCRAVAAPRDGSPPPVWSMTLSRTGDRWAIRSIAPPP